MRQILGPVSILAAGCFVLSLACSSSGPANSSSTGGSSATAGATGGQMGSGGGSVAGGSALLGGTSSTGGASGPGGSITTGGTGATGGNGGSAATGGTAGSPTTGATGGAGGNGDGAATGGASGTGGMVATSGATLTGPVGGTAGATAMGGTQIVTGGATGTGGFARTGGTATAGGTASGGIATGGSNTSGGTSSTGGMAAGGTTATGGKTATGATVSIVSAVPLLDTSGNLVNAHGVGFIKVGNTYYMVGEQRSGKNDTYSGSAANGEDAFSGISMYSTTDFVNWTFVGTVVTPVAGTILYPPQCGERPKILYNASTSKYVIYIKMMTQTGSPSVYIGSFAVLTSSSISGPYALQGTLSLTGADDFQVFQDTDGSQYLVRSEGKLYKLSADGLSIASTVKTGIQSGEGVSLYQAGSTYFWQSSQGSYWHCNDNSYSTATSLTGTWTSHGNFCPTGSKTWESQDTAVVTVTGTSGTTYIYVGDRWVNGHLPASTLVMQPFTVSGSTESIPTYNPIWNLDVAAGTWSPVTPSGTIVNDNTTGSGPNQFTYSTGWTASSCNSCYSSDSHSSSTTGATATIAFTGTRILLYSAYDTSSGIMGVTLSDSSGTAVTPEVQVSLRSDAPATGNYLVYASPIVPSGSYVLKVRVTGLKDLYSSGTTCNIDRVLIQ